MNDASWAVVAICCRMLLYWLTRPARVACAATSATGVDGKVKVSTLVSVPPMAPPAVAEPRVDAAKSLPAEMAFFTVLERQGRRARLSFCSADVQVVERLDGAVGAVAEGDHRRRR